MRFGVFEFDARAGELRKSGTRLRLTGQPLRVLELLLQRPGELVTREELRGELWPADTFVDFERNLNSAVKRLRAALGDSADAPRFIETQPRRGYRFLAHVEAIESAAPVPDAPAASIDAPGRRRLGVLGVSVSAACVAALIGWHNMTPPGAGESRTIQSIAVLPFDNLSGDPEQEYFADGMTEALITSLAQVGPLKVISRTSVMPFRNTMRRLPDIARELAVDAIVEGSVLRDGDRVRITAQLIHASSDEHLWAATYDGHLRDILALQSQVARAIAREVKVTLSPPEEARLARAPPVNPAAHEAYLRARFFWNQRTGDALTRAIAYFNEALEHDAEYAVARAGLAEAYNLLPRYGTASTRAALLTAKEHALAALEVHPELAEAHAALGKVQHSLDWNWQRSEESFRRAIAYSPGYATAHHWYSIFLLSVGRAGEALTEAQRARELDPLSSVINLHLAWTHYLADQMEPSQAALRRTLELAPRDANAYRLLGWIHLRQARYDEAREALQQAVALGGENDENLSALGVLEALSGRPAEARQILRRLEAGVTAPDHSAQQLVWVLLALGETDRAWRWVVHDFENRSVCFYLFHLQHHWLMSPLRADRRLQAAFEEARLEVPADR